MQDTPTRPAAAAAPRPGLQMADHLTPLVRNCWYVAARSDEVGRTLLERTLLGTTVVLYRREDGTPVVLNNRCAHRSFPLSRSRLVGDNIVCGYHGMSYAPSGQCEGMPSLPNCPSHARVASYPAVERFPLVWVWMGDPALADPAKIPDTSWLADPAWATVQGQFRIQSNYVAMHENLLDQTHFGILHPGAVGTPEYARSTLDFRAEGDRVFILRTLHDSPPPGIYDTPMKLGGKRVDRYSDSRFESPAGHIAHARIVDPSPAPGRPAEFRVNITHLFTPERRNSIHYWWFNSRDFDLDDAHASDFLREQSQTAYAQDEEALNWIQQTYDDLGHAPPELSFGPDRPGLAMRKILLRLAQLEA
ncbi:Rieske 2Fe-2S domain-containing protein [Ramlibacter sp. MAHUQ-53]|uniref:Rieske 2Fe-2S domain-containing protein n=1 Tax=unclassified Ramlibacter TaxID=2617605 RepID=UPI003624FA96